MNTPNNIGACYRPFVALLLVIFVSGCTKQAACNLLNNSGSDLTIIRSQNGDHEERIQVQAGSSVLLRDWLFWSYRVTLGEKVLRYSPENPGNDFVVSQGVGPWTRRVFSAQLESDGRIYLLKPGQIFPIKDFVTQPTGFPLAPIAGK